jgi:hypothetical protein
VPTRPPDTLGQPGVSRRLFLRCCAALALAAPGCAALAPRTRLAYTFINDPPLEAYRPVLDALVGAVLPCERPDFPVSAPQAGTRLLTLFQLDTDSRFLAVQKMLLYFEEIDLFPYAFPLMRDERLALDARERGLDVDALLGRKEALERSRYSQFARQELGAERQFSALTLERRRDYLSLWSRSEFLVRRQFYSSARALAMIAAYSMDEVWAAIGYAGPVLPRSRP